MILLLLIPSHRSVADVCLLGAMRWAHDRNYIDFTFFGTSPTIYRWIYTHVPYYDIY